MGKAIKISDKVYHALLDMERPRETFNDVISRLIAVYTGLRSLSNVLGGTKAFGEWQDEQRRPQTPTQ